MEAESPVEGGMTTVNDSHPEEEGMIIDNGHPDEYETQHTSSEDSLNPYANKTLKPDDQIRMTVCHKRSKGKIRIWDISVRN